MFVALLHELHNAKAKRISDKVLCRKSALNVSHIENINSEQFNFCLLVVVSCSMLMNGAGESRIKQTKKKKFIISQHSVTDEIMMCFDGT